jgi:hypothetical protein
MMMAGQKEAMLVLEVDPMMMMMAVVVDLGMMEDLDLCWMSEVVVEEAVERMKLVDLM